jgi:hemolysin activation/secretion protein
VKNGVILLQTEAKVGRLRVEGARYDSPQNIRDAVPALAEGKVPDFNQAQQQLTGLNRSADRQVIPVLKPGTMPQTVDVDLKVDDHSPLHGTLELNNDNSPGTSALRTSASLSYSNLWQLGHVISGTYVIAPQHPNDARVYAFSYLAPIRDTLELPRDRRAFRTATSRRSAAPTCSARARRTASPRFMRCPDPKPTRTRSASRSTASITTRT